MDTTNVGQEDDEPTDNADAEQLFRIQDIVGGRRGISRHHKVRLNRHSEEPEHKDGKVQGPCDSREPLGRIHFLLHFVNY
jgi:hypothetical protein